MNEFQSFLLMAFITVTLKFACNIKVRNLVALGRLLKLTLHSCTHVYVRAVPSKPKFYCDSMACYLTLKKLQGIKMTGLK